MNELLKSSQNKDKLSATVQGMLMAFVPVVMAVLQMLDIPLTESAVIEIVQMISALIAIVVMLFGALRKAYNTFK